MTREREEEEKEKVETETHSYAQDERQRQTMIPQRPTLILFCSTTYHLAQL